MSKVLDSITLGCWIVFLAYWLISALRVKAMAERQGLLSALAHRIPVGFGFFLMAYQQLSHPFNTQLTPRADLTQIFGAVICVLGLFVTIWARWTLAGNWSSDVTFKQGHELVKEGPYRFVRHPIYTGLLVMSIGTAIDVGCLRVWLGLAVVFIGFWIKLKQEERLMVRHFPDEYPPYQKQVKALVPFIL